MFKYKQVIIIRTDIRMSKGKVAVQAAHAAVQAVVETLKKKPEWVHEWLSEGAKKVVVRGNNEEELLEYANRAMREDLPVAVIRDAGLTEVPPGTLTAVAIGPAPTEKVDKITSRLKLL